MLKDLLEELKKIFVKKEEGLPSRSSIDSASLTRLFPYVSYDEELRCFINQTTVGWGFELPPLTGANEQQIKVLHQLLTQILKDEVDIQFVSWGSDKISPHLDHWVKLRSQKGGILASVAKARAEYYEKGAYHSLLSQGHFYVRDVRCFIFLAVKADFDETTKNTIITQRQAIEAHLSSLNIILSPIKVEQFISLMSDWICPSENTMPKKGEWDKLNPLSQQITQYDQAVTVYPTHLTVEHNNKKQQVTSYAVKKFPQKVALWNMSDLLGQLFNSSNQMPCPFFLSLNLRLLPEQNSKTKAQVKAMNLERSANSPLRKIFPKLGEEAKEWSLTREVLSEDERLMEGFYHIVTFSREEDALRNDRMIKTLLTANHWEIVNTQYLQWQTYLATFPFMFTEGLMADLRLAGRLRILRSFNAINIAPVMGEWKGFRDGNVLLPTKRGQLAFWDPFKNEAGNYNISLAAASGSGKSFFTQEYIASMLSTNGRVWVLDIGRSYQKTCELFDGQYIEFKPNAPICLNPFSRIKNMEEMRESSEMLSSLVAAMARPTGQTTDEENSFIQQALMSVFEHEKSNMNIDHLIIWFKEHDDPRSKNLGSLLFNYSSEGSYGKYFIGKSNIDLDNRFVVLELEELKNNKSLMQVVLLLLLFQINVTMYLGDRSIRKSCIIDEAWDLMDGENKQAAKFIETGYRRARRYNANFFTITQSVQDYFKNPQSQAAYTNSAWMILLRQESEQIDQVKDNKQFTMDAFTERSLRSLSTTKDYSEVMIRGSMGISLHRFIVDYFTRILYSSKGLHVTAVEKYKKQGMTLDEAVAKVAQEEYGDIA
jgi:conjugal transfer ATP-binding protein TraC